MRDFAAFRASLIGLISECRLLPQVISLFPQKGRKKRRQVQRGGKNAHVVSILLRLSEGTLRVGVSYWPENKTLDAIVHLGILLSPYEIFYGAFGNPPSPLFKGESNEGASNQGENKKRVPINSPFEKGGWGD